MVVLVSANDWSEVSLNAVHQQIFQSLLRPLCVDWGAPSKFRRIMTLWAFISCLCRASGSARCKRLGSFQVLPGYENDSLDHQECVRAFKSAQ